MSTSKTIGSLAGQLQTLYRLGAAGSLSDRQLLARFLDRSDLGRSEAAFAELIERHGPMVLNVCKRLLDDGQDAHDAFQATFLVLVRRGAAIRKPESLACWLFGIATRVARQARREASLRRQQLERLVQHRPEKYQVACTRPGPDAEPDWPVLYEEMYRLPESFRAPLILHYFEGLSTEAIALKLGCPRGTVLSRLARARQTLKDRLERRGVSSSSLITVGPGALRQSAATIAGHLAQATTRAAMGLLLAGTALENVAPASVASLTLGALRSLVVAQLRRAAAIVFLLVVACASLGIWIVRPSSAEVAAAVPKVPSIGPQEPKKTPASPVVPTSDTEPDEMVGFRGRVVGPDGNPLAGAKVYLDYFVWSEYRTGAPPRLRATSDSDGRFQFRIAKSYFARQLVVEPWQYAIVFAVADGLGLGFSNSEQPDCDRELTIPMPRDDAPLAGRLVDLEGRPVSGASVRVTTISAPPGGDLTPFLNAGRDSKVRIYELKSKYLQKEVRSALDSGFIRPVTSGPDGRFLIRGIGRERMVDLEIEGPAIRWQRLYALTRPGAPIDIVDLYRKKDPWITRFHGASLDLTLAPSRPYEGVIRDRDSGAPISGVLVESFRLADSNISNYTLIKTKSDKDGGFRLLGMPLGSGNEVVLTPPDDQPYLLAQYKLPTASDMKPIKVDLLLKRGIWMGGRVTDKVSGKPVAARLRYSAALKNPHIEEVPGIRDLQYGGGERGSYFNREDGSFRIPVLSGPGLMIVYSLDENMNYAADEGVFSKPNEALFVPYPYGLGSACAEINPAETTASVSHDFALNPAPYKTVTGLIFDPDGKPLSGVRYYGMIGAHWWTPPQKDNRFTVTELRPTKPRTLSRLVKIRDADSLGAFLVPEASRPVVFVHGGKKLAGYKEVGWDTPEPIEVRLEPWCVVTGRLVDPAGLPRASFGMRPHLILKNRLRLTEVPHCQERVFTDSSGRFRVEGLAPGRDYRLVYENARSIQTQAGYDIAPLKPGETRDLGDIKAIVPAEND
jgi:RNA polymerase sigma factor (sigma-70 family)